MGENEAEDWLSVAMREVAGYSIGALDQACLHARRTCTHHSQIVPAVIEAADTHNAREARLREFSAPAQPDVPRLTQRRMTQADVDALPPKLRTLGLKLGYLEQDEGGNVKLTAEDAA